MKIALCALWFLLAQRVSWQFTFIYIHRVKSHWSTRIWKAVPIVCDKRISIRCVSGLLKRGLGDRGTEIRCLAASNMYNKHSVGITCNLQILNPCYDVDSSPTLSGLGRDLKKYKWVFVPDTPKNRVFFLNVGTLHVYWRVVDLEEGRLRSIEHCSTDQHLYFLGDTGYYTGSEDTCWKPSRRKKWRSKPGVPYTLKCDSKNEMKFIAGHFGIYKLDTKTDIPYMVTGRRHRVYSIALAINNRRIYWSVHGGNYGVLYFKSYDNFSDPPMKDGTVPRSGGGRYGFPFQIVERQDRLYLVACKRTVFKYKLKTRPRANGDSCVAVGVTSQGLLTVADKKGSMVVKQWTNQGANGASTVFQNTWQHTLGGGTIQFVPVSQHS